MILIIELTSKKVVLRIKYITARKALRTHVWRVVGAPSRTTVTERMQSAYTRNVHSEGWVARKQWDLSLAKQKGADGVCGLRRTHIRVQGGPVQQEGSGLEYRMGGGCLDPESGHEAVNITCPEAWS